jgi:hypothetical protein
MDREYKIDSRRFGEINIKIADNGLISVDGIERQNDFDEVQSDSMRIWNSYKSYRSNDIVIRSGSGLCGVYRYDPSKPVNKDYVESDTLHSTTVEELAINVFRYYPMLFEAEDKERILKLLRYHDLGETVDNPDDGSKDRDEKFTEELETFTNKISNLPLWEQKQLIKDFIIFENAGLDIWNDHDKRVMQFAKLCDKADAPLGALLYENQGRHGSLLFKKEHFGGITQQDQNYADEIGEYSQAGIWAAHMIDTYLYFYYLDIFIEIIVEACKDVRGNVFPWMYEFCKKRGINERVLELMF